MQWLLLIIAAIFEIGWPLGFKLSSTQPERFWTWIQDSQTSPNYSPKHGTVIRITKKEYKRIVKLLGNK